MCVHTTTREQCTQTFLKGSHANTGSRHLLPTRALAPQACCSDHYRRRHRRFTARRVTFLAQCDMTLYACYVTLCLPDIIVDCASYCIMLVTLRPTYVTGNCLNKHCITTLSVHVYLNSVVSVPMVVYESSMCLSLLF